MTILFLISSEGYFGIESMLVTLAQSLTRLGCRCLVGVFRDSRISHIEVADTAERLGLAVELIPCRGRLDWQAVARIRHLLRKHDVDVLHPHGYKADLYAYAASRLSPVHLVATSHNWPNPRAIMRAYAVCDRFLLRRFDRVVAVSLPVMNLLRSSRVRADRLSYIPNGVAIDRFRSASPTLNDKFAEGRPARIGFVGRCVAEKGGADLLQAARRVINQAPATTFMFIGDGPVRDQWEALARELGIAEQVVFTGVRNDMPGVYASLDMLVLPSLMESLPMCLLEAMAAGKPVIATRVGAIPSVISHRSTGFLVEPGDVGGLAKSILSLLKNPSLSRQVSESAQRLVSQSFSDSAMAAQYLTLYQQLLGRLSPMKSRAVIAEQS